MKNKKIWWFLLRFFGTYLVLFLLYSVFLSVTEQKENIYKCDPLTQNVAQLSGDLLQVCGYSVITKQEPLGLWIDMQINNQYVFSIVEGCNAASIIILFIAFVIAFKGTLKRTILFCLFGIVTIYAVNIIRISILGFGVLNFKNHTRFLHDVFFPAVIYGYIFLLWIIWVNKFSNLKKKDS